MPPLLILAVVLSVVLKEARAFGAYRRLVLDRHAERNAAGRRTRRSESRLHGNREFRKLL